MNLYKTNKISDKKNGSKTIVLLPFFPDILRKHLLFVNLFVSVNCIFAQFLFDAEQLVIFCHPV